MDATLQFADGSTPDVVAALAITRHDAFSILVILGGLVCQALHRRMPAGLGTSLFVAATTAGAAVAAFQHNWPDARTSTEWAFLAAHITTGLCVLWAMLGWVASRRDKHAGVQPAPSSSATFLAWALVTGIAATVLILFPLVFRIWERIVTPSGTGAPIAAAGLWDIAGMTAAAGLWVVTRRRPQQPVILLALAAFFVTWTAMMLPTERVVVGIVPPIPQASSWLPGWWTWTLHLQVGLAVLLLLAAVLQDVPYRRRLARAWPDRLDDLVAPYSRWPAYVQIEAVLAAVILVLGVYQIVRPGDWSWQPGLVSSLGAAVAGTVCLFLAHRRWSTNTAELAIALTTLAVVVLAATLAAPFGLSDPGAEYARRLPILFNAVLFGLLFMIWFWSWLARFWEQQVPDGGPAWTTAGRMIPPLGRATFLVSALAVLISFQMAIWPERVATVDTDNTPGRIAAGLIAITLLAVVTARQARRCDSSAWATLSVALVAAAFFFGLIRMPTSAERGWLVQYAAACLALGCLPVLALAEWVPKTRWRSFAGPLWISALLFMPARALWLILPSDRLGPAFAALAPAERLPAEWVRPMTLAICGAVYGLAGGREGRRAFLVLAGVLLLAAAATLYRTYKDTILATAAP